jgi:hypothetical protein
MAATSLKQHTAALLLEHFPFVTAPAWHDGDLLGAVLARTMIAPSITHHPHWHSVPRTGGSTRQPAPEPPVCIPSPKQSRGVRPQAGPVAFHGQWPRALPAELEHKLPVAQSTCPSFRSTRTVAGPALDSQRCICYYVTGPGTGPGTGPRTYLQLSRCVRWAVTILAHPLIRLLLARNRAEIS